MDTHGPMEEDRRSLEERLKSGLEELKCERVAALDKEC